MKNKIGNIPLNTSSRSIFYFGESKKDYIGIYQEYEGGEISIRGFQINHTGKLKINPDCSNKIYISFDGED